MTFQSMEDSSKYNCTDCKDTGWIINEDGTCKRCKCYEKDVITRLWKNFGINPDEVKKLNEYAPYDELTKKARDKAINYIKNFEDIRQCKENSFGLFGQPGAGKTHIIVAIGAALLNMDPPVKVVYMPYLEAMKSLKANVQDEEYYIRLCGRYQMAEVLIIDDLFKDKVKNGKFIKINGQFIGLTEADMKHIYPIINYRYINNLPTLISTECTPDMLIDLDEALAGRLIEKCGDNMVVFNGQKYNYRMKKYEKVK
ncbi:DNA replication protein DnaC [Caloramator quimbayensis]|uniref:DNA replication protein DnaC n=2 Tax=Caloramator quimbayensis TaxID=1147123 RepID=A0A1T4YIH0_9CLOT|nr:DnaA/Hda family protein [Caloramator quimbayensis]SKB01045.1 DNA replication protein DnaC [Caloramator quimbayensis]